MTIEWRDIWMAVSGELSEHDSAGLQAFLTEDVVRFATVRALARGGVSPAELHTEWRAAGPAIDLAVGEPVHTAVEFKFPREPHEKNAAWTQHLGELLKDFFRLAHLPASVGDRWCVQVVSERLRRYLDGVETNHGLRLGMSAGDVTFIGPDVHRVLPRTASDRLAPWSEHAGAVTARCTDVLDAGAGLRLVIHSVEHIGLPGSGPSRSPS